MLTDGLIIVPPYPHPSDYNGLERIWRIGPICSGVVSAAAVQCEGYTACALRAATTSSVPLSQPLSWIISIALRNFVQVAKSSLLPAKQRE